jgi:hypothetical protein
MFFEAIEGACSELVQCPAGFSNVDNGHIEVTTLEHCLQCGKDLFYTPGRRLLRRKQARPNESCSQLSPYVTLGSSSEFSGARRQARLPGTVLL